MTRIYKEEQRKTTTVRNDNINRNWFMTKKKRTKSRKEKWEVENYCIDSEAPVV